MTRPRDAAAGTRVEPVPGKKWLYTLPGLLCPFCGRAGVLKDSGHFGALKEWNVGCPSAFVPHGSAEDGYYECSMKPCSVMHVSQDSAIEAWSMRATPARGKGRRKG